MGHTGNILTLLAAIMLVYAPVSGDNQAIDSPRKPSGNAGCWQWSELERQLWVDSTLELAYPAILVQVRERSDVLAKILDNAPTSVLLEMTAQADQQMLVIPFVGACALFERSPANAQIAMIRILRKSGILMPTAPAYLELLGNVDKRSAFEVLLDESRAAFDDTALFNLAAVCVQLELEPLADEWIHSDQSEMAPLSVQAQFLSIVWDWRRQNGKEITARMKELLNGYAVFPGFPQQTFAYYASETDKRLVPVLTCLLLAWDADRPQGLDDAGVVLSKRASFILKHIDLDTLRISDEMIEILQIYRETSERGK